MRPTRQKDKSKDLIELGKRLAEGKWAAVGIVIDGQAIGVDGVNPWKHEWESLGVDAQLPHPSYPNQRHAIEIWRIKTDRRMIYFAAGELSANVWGFCLPADRPNKSVPKPDSN